MNKWIVPLLLVALAVGGGSQISGVGQASCVDGQTPGLDPQPCSLPAAPPSQ